MFFLGPSMSNGVYGHEMVKINTDSVVIGGYAGNGEYSSLLYRLTCHNHDCEWHTMNQMFKITRQDFVAIAIPDELTDCWNSN